MDLHGVQQAWDRLAERSPLESMLAAPVSRTITNMEQYFAFGREHTAEVMTYIKSLGVTLKGKRALDYGCGLGKSTQALADYFDEVYGLDIAPSILKLADSHNRYPRRCQYILNETNDLARFEDQTVDFICCYGVLVAVSPTICKNYINEFMRILAPGGVLIFQLPSEPARTVKGFMLRIAPVNLMNLYRRSKYGLEVYATRKSEVIDLICRAGGNVLNVRDDSTHCVGDGWMSFEYCVTK